MTRGFTANGNGALRPEILIALCFEGTPANPSWCVCVAGTTLDVQKPAPS